jgi:hypothetical protein
MRHLPRIVIFGLLLTALTACIRSQTPLLSDAKPLLGDQFQLQLYEDFVDERAQELKTSVFRWTDDRYALVSGDAEGVKYFVAQPTAGSDFIIQSSDGKTYLYFLGRRIADGTYRIISVDQNDVDEGARNALCVTKDMTDCTIATRAQLDTFVHAAAGKLVSNTPIAVISVVAAR